jgi:hypothetical protein
MQYGPLMKETIVFEKLDDLNSALAIARLPDGYDLRIGRRFNLILDEPTNDRMSAVRMANRILALEGGRIREQGSHSQVVALGGRYAGLFELQAAG